MDTLKPSWTPTITLSQHTRHQTPWVASCWVSSHSGKKSCFRPVSNKSNLHQQRGAHVSAACNSKSSTCYFNQLHQQADGISFLAGHQHFVYESPGTVSQRRGRGRAKKHCNQSKKKTYLNAKFTTALAFQLSSGFIFTSWALAGQQSPEVSYGKITCTGRNLGFVWLNAIKWRALSLHIGWSFRRVSYMSEFIKNEI